MANVDRVTGETRRHGPVTPIRYERERPGEHATPTSRRWRIPDGERLESKGPRGLDAAWGREVLPAYGRR